MEKFEKDNVKNAVQQVLSQVQRDFFGASKALKKAAHKARMKNFQNNAYKKEKK